jgi:Domain of unknown function (DUF4338)/Transposase Tn5 dimerisation domain/Transposase DNA-binding
LLDGGEFLAQICRVLVLGRRISPEAIERLQTQAADSSRRRLAGMLCQELQWVGPGGKPQISVAMDALLRLSQQGALKLPPAGAQPGKVTRGVSSQPAVAVVMPPLEGELALVQPIELVKVSKRRSREYGLWRQLLEEHHYLGAGPLCGHQLRYLIKGAGGNWLGAAAFSAAARRVAARDGWIGWTQEARRENLPWVISNSRFLILPQVRIANLASHVLGQLLQHVAQDWQEQFGYRPVLVESFVDLERFRGTCYQAANWKLLGLTCGRGRQDSSHMQALSKKLLYVYRLCPEAQARLCALPARRRLALLPVAAPPPPLPPRNWLEEEFGAVVLPDERLKRRLQTMAADFFARPAMNLPQACGRRAKTKAAYRFLDHKAVNLNTLLSGHYQATQVRAAKERVILAVQDTTELNYSAHPATQMLGPLTHKAGTMGLLLHETMAYNLEGTPLGLLDVQCWARDPEQPCKREQRYQLPLQAKESSKWLVSHAAASQLQAHYPEHLVVSVGDREADLYELFVQAQQRPQAAKILVRARQPRRLVEPSAEPTQLWPALRQSPAAGGIELKVPRKKNQPARTVQLEVHFLEVRLRAPKRKPELGAVRCWALCALESTAPPAGVEPIEWMLLTNVPVRTLAEAVEKLQWYALRFQIEVYHRVLKSGCQIEERQLGNAERIEACLAIDLVVAWRIAHLTKLGREVPNLPCTVYFEEAQWQALMVYATRQLPPAQPPKLRELVRLMAMTLGGFLGRKGDGEPGATVIWRGLQRLDDITQMYCAMRGAPWVSTTIRELDSS